MPVKTTARRLWGLLRKVSYEHYPPDKKRTCSIVRSTWLAVSSGSAPCGSSPAMATSAPDTCDVPNKALMLFNVVDDEEDGTGVGFDWYSNFVAIYGCNDGGDGVG